MELDHTYKKIACTCVCIQQYVVHMPIMRTMQLMQ